MIDQILGPFDQFDLAQAYQRYSGIIDFIIFALLFVSICNVTIGKHFAGRGGKAISAAVAMLFTISLVLAEHQFSFNLASFGPIAAGIVLVVVGGTLYVGIRHLGGGHAASGSVAFVVAYLSVRAVTPDFFLWLNEKVPFIHAALAIAVVVAIWHAARLLWPRPGQVLTQVAAKSREEAKAAIREVFPTEQMKHEHDLIKKRLLPFTKYERRASKNIIEDLEEMKRVLKKFGETPYALSQIGKNLRDIRPKEHELEVFLKRLRVITRRFLQVDETVLARIKRKDFSKLGSDEQRLITTLWRKEKEKIKAEHKLQTYEAEVLHLLSRLDGALRQAVASLQAMRPDEAEHQINIAIRTEREAIHLLKKIQRLEKALSKWIEIETKAVTKAT